MCRLLAKLLRFLAKTLAFSRKTIVPRTTLRSLTKLSCSLRNFAFSQNYSIFSQNCCVPWDTLHYLAKRLRFLTRLLHSQRIFASSRKAIVFPENFALSRKTLAISHKTIAFPERLCILLQNHYVPQWKNVHLQYYCSPKKNVFLSQNICTPEKITSLAKHLHFLIKTFAFPQETLRSLAKALKYRLSSHLILFPSQQVCERMQNHGNIIFPHFFYHHYVP